MLWRFLLVVGAVNFTVFGAVFAEDGLDPSEPAKITVLARYSFEPEVRLKVSPLKLRSGGVLKIECELWCIAGAGSVYNGFLQGREHLPARIVFSSVNGDICRELLGRQMGIQKSKDADWIFLRSQQCVGREMNVRISNSPIGNEKSESNELHLTLPPGEYNVQAIYNHWLFATWPNRPSRRKKGNPAAGVMSDQPIAVSGRTVAQMDEPVAVSEMIKIVIE